VITIAGGPARHPQYLEDLAGLGDQNPLVIPHLRGVGRSPAPEDGDRGSFWRQAEDIDRLRVHLGQQRSVLAAHSAGTRLALSYAAEFPDHVAALVLITPPAAYMVQAESDSEHLARVRGEDVVFRDAWTLMTAGADVENNASFNAWQVAIAPAGYAQWGEREQAHAASGEWNLAAALAYLAAPVPEDLPARLAALEAPVLVIAGAQDALTGIAPVKALAGFFTDGRLEVIEGCGHYPWVEQPAAFRMAVDPLLQTVSAH
jgi:pimeloyl-ACP methyl ester carboxylesterase